MTARFRQQSVIGHPGVAVQFIDLSTSSPTAWSWTFYDTDGITILGTSTEQNPIFVYPIAGQYPTSLCVVETGVPTSPPPVDPGGPPDPTFPPTDPPLPVSDDPPSALLAGRTLGIDHEFANGIPSIWTVLSGASGREGTIQTWDTALTTFDSEGLHLAMEEDAPGGPFRSGAVEAQLGTRHGLYAFKVTAIPIGHALRTSIILYSQTGDQEIGIFEFPNVDPTHYYTRTTFPNTPTRPILFDPTDDHIFAVDWRGDSLQFYLDWYALGNPITGNALALIASGVYAVSIHTLVGGPWAGAPDGSTDLVFSDGEELVLEWFRYWPGEVTAAPDPPPIMGATDAAYRNALLAEVQGFAVGAVTGGRNGPLYVVRNTADSGAGSFRDAISQGNRWIIFDPLVFPRGVPVAIPVPNRLDARNIPNITIDCYGSLPYLTGYGISTGDFSPSGSSRISNNWIINNVKHTGTPAGDANDCLTLDGIDRGVLLHGDFQQGGDGSVDITMTGSGPNPYGLWSWGFCKIGDAQGGKGCLIEDQTGPDPAYDQPNPGSSYPGSYAYFQPSSIWPSGAALDRNCYLTIHDCEFFGTLRNPVVANFGVHLINSYHHSYDLEGLSIFGFNAKVRATCPVVDGAGASFPERGILSWDFDNPGTGHPPDRMRKWVLIERPAYRNGATFTDGSSYTNPDGNHLVIPYNYSVDEVQGDSGAAVIARLTAGITNTRRAGQIDRAGYAEIVGIP